MICILVDSGRKARSPCQRNGYITVTDDGAGDEGADKLRGDLKEPG